MSMNAVSPLPTKETHDLQEVAIPGNEHPAGTNPALPELPTKLIEKCRDLSTREILGLSRRPRVKVGQIFAL
jgi:hypothetical protein